MKKVNLFSMVTALLLAATSCSDDIDNGGNNPGEPIDGNGVYLSVNIMTPSTSGAYTKAGEEGTTSSNPSGGENGDDFLSALDKENTVEGVTIVLYGKGGVTDKTAVQNLSINDEGTMVIASSYTSATEGDADNEYDHHTGKKATVRLNSEYLKTNTYYRILAIANANVTDKFVPGTSLAACKINTIANDLSGTEGKFIMSTHVEENTPKNSTETDYSIVSFTNKNIEENDPATGTVWVERLSARIDYVGTTFEFPVKETGTENVIAKVELQGVAPVNVAKHPVYIFKHLTDDDSNINGTLKALINEEYTSTKKNYVIEPTTIGRTGVTDDKQFDNQFVKGFVNSLSFKSFTDTNWGTNTESETTPGTQKTYRIITYAGENTMAYNQQTHGNTTGVIFKAKYDPEKLLVYNETDGTDLGQVAPENKPTGGFTTGFYRVDNKLYKELEAAEAELIITGTGQDANTPLAWLRKNFTKDTWSLPTEITFDNFKSAVGAAATLKDLGYLKFLSDKLSATGVTAVNATTMNWAAFLDANTALGETNANWKMSSLSSNEIQTIEYFDANHTCYYPYWIRHANNGNDETMGIMEFCIVRNNVYRLSVTGIDGLGMADPFDDANKPDEGEEEGYYLKVELYVHDWVVRENENIILKPGN